LKKIIERNISGKKVLGLFILTNLVYAFMLVITIPKTMKFSKGMKLLDMMPTGYDFNYVKNLFDSLGEKGRETYLTNQIPVDMVYPLLFGVSYCLLMAYLLKKLHKMDTSYFYFCFLPLIAGAADYLENIGIIILLKRYPNITETTVYATNTFSVIKSISTSIFFITLIVVLIQLSMQSFKNKRNNNYSTK